MPLNTGALHLPSPALAGDSRRGKPALPSPLDASRAAVWLRGDETRFPAPDGLGREAPPPTAAPASWGTPRTRRRSATCRCVPCGSLRCAVGRLGPLAPSQAAAGRLAPRAARPPSALVLRPWGLHTRMARRVAACMGARADRLTPDRSRSCRWRPADDARLRVLPKPVGQLGELGPRTAGGKWQAPWVARRPVPAGLRPGFHHLPPACFLGHQHRHGDELRKYGMHRAKPGAPRRQANTQIRLEI